MLPKERFEVCVARDENVALGADSLCQGLAIAGTLEREAGREEFELVCDLHETPKIGDEGGWILLEALKVTHNFLQHVLGGHKLICASGEHPPIVAFWS